MSSVAWSYLGQTWKASLASLPPSSFLMGCIRFSSSPVRMDFQKISIKISTLDVVMSPNSNITQISEVHIKHHFFPRRTQHSLPITLIHCVVSPLPGADVLQLHRLWQVQSRSLVLLENISNLCKCFSQNPSHFA